MTAPLSGQDALLATKLHVPEPHGFVQRRLPIAWVGLDDGDSDSARFWRYAVAEFETLVWTLLSV